MIIIMFLQVLTLDSRFPFNSQKWFFILHKFGFTEDVFIKFKKLDAIFVYFWVVKHEEFKFSLHVSLELWAEWDLIHLKIINYYNILLLFENEK